MNTEEFIERAIEVHGDKYDYSKVEYKNSTTKVCIICPKHGEFWQRPLSHIHHKSGCPMCGGSHKLSTQEFIQRAKEIHGDKYNYSKVEYKNMKTPINIICFQHGEFWQRPEDHIFNKSGCPMCFGIVTYDTKTFIERAKQVHGDKYDYSKVEYKSAKEKVCIICKEHGEFWQTPDKHLKGQGCPKCSYIFRGEKKRKNFQAFMDKIPSNNKNKFLYDEKSFIKMSSKIRIKCLKCNQWFEQKASLHTSLNQGCPHCNKSKMEQELKIFLQENKIKFEEQKRFEWLGQQSLDFYLPEHNIAIECQGIQHFKPIDFGGKGNIEANKHFSLVLENDAKKFR